MYLSLHHVKLRTGGLTAQVLILGCGFTGRRVARILLRRGLPVRVTSRAPERLAALAKLGAGIVPLDLLAPGAGDVLRTAATPGCLVLHSIPTLPGGLDAEIAGILGKAPARVVYLSTTGVYGDAREVNERTPPAPKDERGRLRLETEKAMRSGPWSTMVLRPAAIYGPDRGIQMSIREPGFRIYGDGSNFISRIHADDLAAHAAAALASRIPGAFPVADMEPCSSLEIARYCAGLLGLDVPDPGGAADVPETRRSDRRVDGAAIRQLLGVVLRYPSYRDGIPAALAAEFAMRVSDQH